MRKKLLYAGFLAVILFLPYILRLASPLHHTGIAGIDLEFFLFGLTLLTVSLFHKYTMYTAVTGLVSVVLYKVLVLHYPMIEHLEEEKMILINLFGLLLGFALLARHFEESHLPKLIPAMLPANWKGPFLLLVLVFVLSSFLDNIAAALIGGTLALVIFNGRVHIGYIAAIVAASNAGGSGSVVGDTTTTMMWIEGVPAIKVMDAYLAALPAVCIFGYFASRQQYGLQGISKGNSIGIRIDYKKLLIVFLILAGAILTNIFFRLPALGVWIALGIGTLFSTTSWSALPAALRSSVFLLSLVFIASLMPVEELPDASSFTAFILGFISSVFDNIPLTKLALSQNHYDWGTLAFTVGFGGSMIWFGSSAGVAITSIYPEARSVGRWVRYGWHILAAYVIGFLILHFVAGWHPTAASRLVL
jgi:Na+/H+ antiporter NhaD/arsenite permease-like protein